MQEPNNAALIAAIRKEVGADVEQILDRERKGLMFIVKAAGWLGALIIAAVTWLGWDSMRSMREQAKSDLIASTEAYLKTNANVKEVQQVLDRYHVATLISYHQANTLFEREDSIRDEPIHLSISDAAKLIDVVCNNRGDPSLPERAASVLLTASVEPWWEQFEARLIDLIAVREQGAKEDGSACVLSDASTRAALVQLLIPVANMTSFARLKPIMDKKSEDSSLRAAVLQYAAAAGADALAVERVLQLGKEGEPDLKYASLVYLARWFPEQKELGIWASEDLRAGVENRGTAQRHFEIAAALFSDIATQSAEADNAAVSATRVAALRQLLASGVRFVVLAPSDDTADIRYMPTRWRARTASNRPVQTAVLHTFDRMAFESAYAEMLREAIASSAGLSGELLMQAIDGLSATPSSQFLPSIRLTQEGGIQAYQNNTLTRLGSDVYELALERRKAEQITRPSAGQSGPAPVDTNDAKEQVVAVLRPMSDSRADRQSIAISKLQGKGRIEIVTAAAIRRDR